MLLNLRHTVVTNCLFSHYLTLAWNNKSLFLNSCTDLLKGNLSEQNKARNGRHILNDQVVCSVLSTPVQNYA